MSMAAAISYAQLLRDCHEAIRRHLLNSGFPAPHLENRGNSPDDPDFLIFSVNHKLPPLMLAQLVSTALQNSGFDTRANSHDPTAITILKDGHNIGHITLINETSEVKNGSVAVQIRFSHG